MSRGFTLLTEKQSALSSPDKENSPTVKPLGEIKGVIALMQVRPRPST